MTTYARLAHNFGPAAANAMVILFRAGLIILIVLLSDHPAQHFTYLQN